MIERMSAWRRAIVAGWLLAGLAWGQLTEDPATWMRAQGNLTADARPADLMAVLQASGLALRSAALAGKPRNEASALVATTQRLLKQGNVNWTWRMATRVLAVSEGLAPGEWLEVATSFDVTLDRAVLTPGSRLYVRLSPLFVLTTPLKNSYTVRWSVLNEAGEELSRQDEPLPETMAPFESSIDTARLSEGRYRLRYELLEGEQQRATCERTFFVDSRLRPRLAELRGHLRQAQLRGAATPRGALALAAVEAAAEDIDRWLHAGPTGEAGWRHPFVEGLALKRLPALASPRPDFTGWQQAERFAKALAEGRPPLDAETGSLRLARRVDDTLVPFRLFRPTGTPPEKGWPLVVLRHSFLGDEGTFGHLFGEDELAALAVKHGAVVYCPLNSSAYSDPNDQLAAQLDAGIADIVTAFGADPSRVFLAGHGTAAAEALIFGLGRAPRFAAVGAVAGAPPRLFDTKPGAGVPVLYIYSTTDEIAPERELRKWAAYIDTRLKNGKSITLDKQSHIEAAKAALPRLFEFFLTPPSPPE
jgi:poly(3-hydroxybutyrate) depolymerase